MKTPSLIDNCTIIEFSLSSVSLLNDTIDIDLARIHFTLNTSDSYPPAEQKSMQNIVKLIMGSR